MAEISIVGVVVVLVLLTLAVALFVVIDRASVNRVLKTFGLMAVQMALVGGGVWLVFKMDAWWVNVLWLLVMMVLSAVWCLYLLRDTWKQMMLPVCTSLLAGSLVAGGSLMLCLPGRAFVPVFGVVLACLMVSVRNTLQTYRYGLMHTETHRQYLQANGASTLESLMPTVRRALRASIQSQLRTMAQPLLVAMPLLFAGMLLGGASPLTSVVVALLFWAAAYVASVAAGIVALYSFKR